jgi:hypothetical protein
VIAARSQVSLAQANGKRDLGLSFNYTHVGAVNSAAFFFNMEFPIFDRNQGEIARTQAAVTQSDELYREESEQVMSDVVNAYEGLHTNDEIVGRCTGPAIWTRPRNRAIFPNTRTSTAPPVCSISWTRSGVIAPTSWPTGRRWLPIWCRSNRSAPPSEQGICHEREYDEPEPRESPRCSVPASASRVS